MMLKYIALALLLSIFLVACKKLPMEVAIQSYVAHDYSRAFKELLKPAAEGDPEAQYALGYMYYYGLGIAKDQDMARLWITKAAQNNYLQAIQALKSINQVRVAQNIPLA